eukprot:12575902-Alexandrium_andersonii.AAC.1
MEVSVPEPLGEILTQQFPDLRCKGGGCGAALSGLPEVPPGAEVVVPRGCVVPCVCAKPTAHVRFQVRARREVVADLGELLARRHTLLAAHGRWAEEKRA